MPSIFLTKQLYKIPIFHQEHRFYHIWIAENIYAYHPLDKYILCFTGSSAPFTKAFF